MNELMPKLVTILQKYMANADAHASAFATLSDLGIDVVDLPLIGLDIEDVFNVQVQNDVDIAGSTTVHGLAAYVSALALVPRRRTSVPRSTQSWFSTGAERRR